MGKLFASGSTKKAVETEVTKEKEWNVMVCYFMSKEKVKIE